MTLYYVNSETGSDSNPGTESEPWETIDKVNTESTYWSAGDGVLFARGMSHYGSIDPNTNGSDGNPIIFGAYGSGAPPIITPTMPFTSWSSYDTNIWRSYISPGINSTALFNGIIGDRQTSIGNVVDDYDFCYSGGYLYIYAESDPVTYYDSVQFMTQYYPVNLSNVNYIRFQQLYLKDYYRGFRLDVCTGVDIFYCVAEDTLRSDNLQSTIGIILTNATNCKMYNCDIIGHRYGIHNTAGSGHLLKNSRVYAALEYNLSDSANAITYSNCHFYAGRWKHVLSDGFNNAGIYGGIDGGNNISYAEFPNVKEWRVNEPGFGVRVDDIGLEDGVNDWIDSFLSEYNNRSYMLTLGVVTAGDYTEDVESWLESRVSEGHSICSHSRTHQPYWTLNAVNIQYIGGGYSCELSISGNTLSTTVAGATGEDLNIDLTNSSYDEISELVSYTNGLDAYSCTKHGDCHPKVHSDTLADVSSQDITSEYTIILDKDRLVKDELSDSKSWLEANINGLTSCDNYIWPGTYSDEDTRQWCEEAGYETALAGTGTAYYPYNAGLEVYKLLGGWASNMHGESESEIKRKVIAACFVSGISAIPIYMYIHKDELSSTEMTWIAEALESIGVPVCKSADDIKAYLYNGENVGAGRWGVAKGAIDLGHKDDSPCRDAGEDLGLTEDILGNEVPQETYPSIGAYEWTAEEPPPPPPPDKEYIEIDWIAKTITVIEE